MPASTSVLAFSAVALIGIVLLLRKAFVLQKDVIATSETTLKLSAASVLAAALLSLSIAMAVGGMLRNRPLITLGVAPLCFMAVAAYIRIFPRFVRIHRLRAASRDGDAATSLREVERLSPQLGLAKVPECYVSDLPGGSPFVFGDFRRSALVLPADFEAAVTSIAERTAVDSEELRTFILVHELSHIKHKDFAFICWASFFTDMVSKYWLPLFCTLTPLWMLTRNRTDLRDISIFVAVSLLVLLPLIVIRFILITGNRERELLADARAALFLRPETRAVLLRGSQDLAGASALAYALGRFSMPCPTALALASDRKRARQLPGNSPQSHPTVRSIVRIIRRSLRTHPPEEARTAALATNEFVDERRFVPSLENSVWVGLSTGYLLFAYVALHSLTTKWPALAPARVLGLGIPLYLAFFFFAPASNALRIPSSRSAVIRLLATRMIASFLAGVALWLTVVQVVRPMAAVRELVVIAAWIFAWYASGWVFASLLVLISLSLRGTSETATNRESAWLLLSSGTMGIPIVLLSAASTWLYGLIPGFTGVIISLSIFKVRRFVIPALRIGLWDGEARICLMSKTITLQFAYADAVVGGVLGITIGLLGFVIAAAAAPVMRFPLQSVRFYIWTFAMLTICITFIGRVTGSDAFTTMRRRVYLSEVARLVNTDVPVDTRWPAQLGEYYQLLFDEMPHMETVYWYAWLSSASNITLPPRLCDWISSCRHSRGFSPWPGAKPTLRATARAIDILGNSEAANEDLQCHAMWLLSNCWRDGGFAESWSRSADLESTWLAVRGIHSAGLVSLIEREKCALWVNNTWASSDADYESTYLAFDTLRMLSIRGERASSALSQWIQVMYWDAINLRVDQNSRRLFYFLSVASNALDTGNADIRDFAVTVRQRVASICLA